MTLTFVECILILSTLALIITYVPWLLVKCIAAFAIGDLIAVMFGTLKG